MLKGKSHKNTYVDDISQRKEDCLLLFTDWLLLHWHHVCHKIWSNKASPITLLAIQSFHSVSTLMGCSSFPISSDVFRSPNAYIMHPRCHVFTTFQFKVKVEAKFVPFPSDYVHAQNSHPLIASFRKKAHHLHQQQHNRQRQTTNKTMLKEKSLKFNYQRTVERKIVYF